MAENQILVKFKPSGEKRLINAINQLHLAQVKLEKGQKAYQRALKQTNKQMTAFGTRNKRLTNENNQLANSFATIRSKMLLWSFAMSMGIRQMIDLVQHTSKVHSMRVAFSNLADSAGLASGTLEKLREATDGTMDDFKLLEQANNALLLGVAKNSDQMARMFDVAQRLGKALGKDTAHSVESLITGIGRQSRLMLDNIGIIVKAEEAYEAYAEQLGKTADNLTDAEKKTAFLTAAMTSAEEKVKSLGAELTDADDSFKIFSTAISNALDVIGDKAKPILSNAAKQWGFFIEEVFGQVEPIETYNAEIIMFQKELVSMETHLSFLEDAQKKWNTSGAEYLDLIIRQNPEIETQQQALGRLVKWINTAKTQNELLNKEIEKQIFLYENGAATIVDTERTLRSLNAEWGQYLEKVPEVTVANQNLQASVLDMILSYDTLNEKVIPNLSKLTGAYDQALGSIEANMVAMDEKAKLEELDAANSIKNEERRRQKIDQINVKYEKKAEDRAKKLQIWKVASATSNTALGITQILADPSLTGQPWMKFILSSMVAASGAAQIATIRGEKFEQGGMVGGRRHSQGGTMIEAEQGEFVMSRNAVNAIGVENLNRMNRGGGGAVNITFTGNVMSQDFIENEAIPQIKDAIRRGADIGVS